MILTRIRPGSRYHRKALALVRAEIVACVTMDSDFKCDQRIQDGRLRFSSKNRSCQECANSPSLATIVQSVAAITLILVLSSCASHRTYSFYGIFGLDPKTTGFMSRDAHVKDIDARDFPFDISPLHESVIGVKSVKSLALPSKEIAWDGLTIRMMTIACEKKDSTARVIVTIVNRSISTYGIPLNSFRWSIINAKSESLVGSPVDCAWTRCSLARYLVTPNNPDYSRPVTNYYVSKDRVFPPNEFRDVDRESIVIPSVQEEVVRISLSIPSPASEEASGEIELAIVDMKTNDRQTFVFGFRHFKTITMPVPML